MLSQISINPALYMITKSQRMFALGLTLNYVACLLRLQTQQEEKKSIA